MCMTINLDSHGLELFLAFDHAITLPARFQGGLDE